MIRSVRTLDQLCVGLVLGASLYGSLPVYAQEPTWFLGRMIVGTVQNQDLRRAPQATVEVKNQEGTLVTTVVSNDAGEFSIPVPADETYSVSAVQDTYRSEYIVLKIGAEDPTPISLTLSKTKEIALEVRSPLAPIQYKASSETYSISRKDIEDLPARQQ